MVTVTITCGPFEDNPYANVALGENTFDTSDFEYGWKGGGDRWRASEHGLLRLDRCHFPAHTVAWDWMKKRFPERFLKVEILKAWMAASVLKLHEPLSCYAYHQAEWRQCFNWSTKGRL